MSFSSKTVKVNIQTDEGWENQVSITVDDRPSDDMVDFETRITEACTLWCSDNGYAYENWEYGSEAWGRNARG